MPTPISTVRNLTPLLPEMRFLFADDVQFFLEVNWAGEQQKGHFVKVTLHITQGEKVWKHTFEIPKRVHSVAISSQILALQVLDISKLQVTDKDLSEEEERLAQGGIVFLSCFGVYKMQIELVLDTPYDFTGRLVVNYDQLMQFHA